jgi:hypothetical protein
MIRNDRESGGGSERISRGRERIKELSTGVLYLHDHGRRYPSLLICGTDITSVDGRMLHQKVHDDLID